MKTSNKNFAKIEANLQNWLEDFDSVPNLFFFIINLRLIYLIFLIIYQFCFTFIDYLQLKIKFIQ